MKNLLIVLSCLPCFFSELAYSRVNRDLLKFAYEKANEPASVEDFPATLYVDESPQVWPPSGVNSCVIVEGDDSVVPFYNLAFITNIHSSHGPFFPEKKEEKLFFGSNLQGFDKANTSVTKADLMIFNPSYVTGVNSVTGEMVEISGTAFARRSDGNVLFKIIVQDLSAKNNSENFGYCYPIEK